MKADIAQFAFIDDKLKLMVLDIERHYGVEFTVTSFYRINDPGVHGQLPLRGIDLRCKSQTFGLMIQTYVNLNWRYDSSRPNKKCCLFHDTGSGWHLHLQTHPKTEKI